MNSMRLSTTRSDVLQWQLLGACRAEDSELFFGSDDESRRAIRRREAAAKAVCRRCPVLRECREHVLLTRQSHGVWGGLSESDREDLRSTGLRRGRRRVVAAAAHLVVWSQTLARRP
jgi:WhiB family transcriptional regulator, redox-sensing transcriptional regulator